MVFNNRNHFILFSAIILGLFCVSCYCGEDYYKILGIPRSANIRQIRKAFRTLANKWHPDKNDAPEAEETYQKISKAYETLSKKEKRQIYDQYGEEGLKKGAQAHSHDPFDIFFGGHRHGGGGADNVRKGPNLEMPLYVALEDIYLGKELKVANRRQKLCHVCRGTGAKKAEDVKKCSSCDGKGIKITTRQLGPGFVQQMQTTCDVCGGKGVVAKSKCPHCRGKKVEIEEDEIYVIIEKGMPDGHKITFEQEADEAPDTVSGDLIFTVITQPHERFRREGNDLHAHLQITLLEALVGFETTIEHLDKHQVVIKREEVTIPGQVQVVKGEGMPIHDYPSEKGNLYITYSIRFPVSLTAKQKTQARKLLKGM